jgi:hypothetical protein
MRQHFEKTMLLPILRKRIFETKTKAMASTAYTLFVICATLAELQSRAVWDSFLLTG